MEKKQHILLYVSSKENKQAIIAQLEKGALLKNDVVTREMKGAIYSALTLKIFLDEEYRHDRFDLTKHLNRTLASLSEGEQKKVLLEHLISTKPDYLIVDNIFDSLDHQSQQAIQERLTQLSHQLLIIQLASRSTDFLPFITDKKVVIDGLILPFEKPETHKETKLQGNVPPPFAPVEALKNPLVALNNVSVSFGEKNVLNHISLKINRGEFWQLVGANGSGKSTLLSMIIGDNPKGYGQDLFLFGRKKGTGESVWEVKKHIGYFTNSMVQNFNTRDTIENMVISGYFDSVGLYTMPTNRHRMLAREWLDLIGLVDQYNVPFSSLSLGKQRLLLAVRAMVKYPSLLILDEPTAGLDDDDVQLFVNLINTIAAEKKSAIIYVSHREEKNITPDFIFKLSPKSNNGSEGQLVS